ncbi:Gag protease polyprotein-like protein [Cucumis melo var. makuwa]|uniref:Gag protease polyprotein-like protein n=1 Tax=Cucumis melo var. makuwa TaxID=1194695 RepID=A0A5A7TDG4_CUCMM|nr:Gag protease polyprotein-like protein [Cucumis melo var. makuwa]TYK15232.1 Gag protease polyprotein-like protein [Cucumis melo var. makuwa]
MRQEGKVFAMTQQEAADAPNVVTVGIDKELESLTEESMISTPVGKNEIIFRDDRKILPTSVISALEASKLLRKGCTVYLANVIDTQVSKLKLEDIPVVREFPDVFPEELSGLPPDREIESQLI